MANYLRVVCKYVCVRIFVDIYSSINTLTEESMQNDMEIKVENVVQSAKIVTNVQTFWTFVTILALSTTFSTFVSLL